MPDESSVYRLAATTLAFGSPAITGAMLLVIPVLRRRDFESYLAVLCVAVLFSWKGGYLSKLPFEGGYLSVLLALVGTSIALVAESILAATICKIPVRYDQLLPVAPPDAGAVLKLFSVGFIAIAEEVLHRGLILTWCMEAPEVAQLILVSVATLMFCAIHISFGGYAVILKIPLAVVTAAEVLIFQSLIAAILTHVVFNLIGASQQPNPAVQ